MTSLYAGILGIIYIFISSRVIKTRRSEKVSLGNANNTTLTKFTSAHNNFSNYTPIFLILLYLLEQKNISLITIHITSILFIFGRFSHYFALIHDSKNFKFRIAGMMLTFFPITIFSILNIIYSFI